jgi:D-glycero-D-manno-heptose 1,7-bisphosphate phosphatase
MFLDRDGVLNAPLMHDGRPHPPSTVEELRLLPGVPDSCERLSGTGYTLVCITNQTDIARGTQDPTALAELNERLLSWLPLEEIIVSPHDDADACSCANHGRA